MTGACLRIVIYAWVVWHALHDLVATAPSGSLNSDAVIEIMLAILGCMIGVLTLIAGFVALFGYGEIKRAAIRAAGMRATLVATKIAKEQYPMIFAAAQASSLAESQAEDADKKKGVVSQPDTEVTSDKTFNDDEADTESDEEEKSE